MTFSYSDTETTDIDKVRGRIGDTIENSGPRPANSGSADTNYSNEVITAVITLEKTWQRAVAGVFERLASEWSKKASASFSGGSQSGSVQYNNVSKRYEDQAKEWRRRYGYVEDDDTVAEGVSVGTLNLGFQATNSTS